MIEQYLPQTNEIATLKKSKMFSHLNKVLDKQNDDDAFNLL